MKKLAILFILIFGIIWSTMAQIDKMRDKLDDADAEIEGELTLRFINALDGSAVAGADVDVQGLQIFATDLEGKIRFETINDGVYPFRFEKEGFISENNKFEVIAGTIFWNRFTVSPVIEMGSIRIVLDWDKKPKDLDAHFVKEDYYHISYQNKKVSSDQSAQLDRDDKDGYGPETITVREIAENAEYTFYVKDYTNRKDKKSNALSKSKAMVKLYSEGELVNIWQLGEKQNGNAWAVFNIQNGVIMPTDLVKNYY